MDIFFKQVDFQLFQEIQEQDGKEDDGEDCGIYGWIVCD